MLMMNRNESVVSRPNGNLKMDDSVRKVTTGSPPHSPSHSSVGSGKQSVQSNHSQDNNKKKEELSATKPIRKRRPPTVPWKKPKDMPRRPLSAYNLFFKAEREKLLAGIRGTKNEEEASATSPSGSSSKSKTGLGFANLAKTIAAKWKDLDAAERAPFEERAAVDKQRYDQAILEWRKNRKLQQQEARDAAKDESSLLPSPSNQSNMMSMASVSSFDQTQSVSYPQEWYVQQQQQQQSSGNLEDCDQTMLMMMQGNSPMDSHQRTSPMNSLQHDVHDDLLSQLQAQQLTRASMSHPTFSTSQQAAGALRSAVANTSSYGASTAAWPSTLNNFMESADSNAREQPLTLAEHQQQASAAVAALIHAKSEPSMHNRMNRNASFPTGSNFRGSNSVFYEQGSGNSFTGEHQPQPQLAQGGGSNLEASLHSAWLQNILQRQESLGSQLMRQESIGSAFGQPTSMRQQQMLHSASQTLSQQQDAEQLYQQQQQMLMLQQQQQQQQQQTASDKSAAASSRPPAHLLGLLSEQLDEDSIAFLTNLPFSRNQFE